MSKVVFPITETRGCLFCGKPLITISYNHNDYRRRPFCNSEHKSKYLSNIRKTRLGKEVEKPIVPEEPTKPSKWEIEQEEYKKR